MHGEGSSGGGSRGRGSDRGEEGGHTGTDIVPYHFEEISTDEIFNILEQPDGQGEAGGRDGRGRRGRRGGREGRGERSRRGARLRRDRVADLSGCDDPGLSGEKVLRDFRVLPNDEVHVSTQGNLTVSIFFIFKYVNLICYIYVVRTCIVNLFISNYNQARNIRCRGSLATTLKLYHQFIKFKPRIAGFLHQLGFSYFLGNYDFLLFYHYLITSLSKLIFNLALNMTYRY